MASAIRTCTVASQQPVHMDVSLTAAVDVDLWMDRRGRAEREEEEEEDEESDAMMPVANDIL